MQEYGETMNGINDLEEHIPEDLNIVYGEDMWYTTSGLNISILYTSITLCSWLNVFSGGCDLLQEDGFLC